jgi:hypothetical protein
MRTIQMSRWCRLQSVSRVAEAREARVLDVPLAGEEARREVAITF